MSSSPVLNQRAQHLLKTLIDCYIEEGQPVGSKKLAEAAGLNISPATIRNVMAKLDDRGLITSPHTSAGRVPTELGFRFFVDTMLEVSPLDKQIQHQLAEQLNPDQNQDELIESASNLLSQMTRMAGIISIPKGGRLVLRHIEFLPLSDQRVLVIMVVNEKDVQNRVIHVSRDYTQNELQKVANYLNQHFIGEDIFAVRKRLLEELQKARLDMDSLMQSAVDIASQALQPSDDCREDYRLQGQNNLIRFNELENARKLQQLFDVFESRRSMLGLLDRCIQAEDVQVFIGREAGLDDFDNCSVITSPYTLDGEVLGVLGVIGPTRMQYNRVIPLVDVTARLLSNALNPEK